ncbi:MAG: GGDEF domain-containing protein [Syntrophobacteraceae bacterium]|nr:GGDEF domain-containing protein [Syntrophobacteraceae bacterium]
MKTIEFLSQLVIDTLRQLHSENKPLTNATLSELLASREEKLLSLFLVMGEDFKEKGLSLQGEKIACATLKKTANEIAPDHFSWLQYSFSKILESLAPLVKGEKESQYSQLLKETKECGSLASLSKIANDISSIADSVITASLEYMAYTNDFMVELSKDIYKVEEQVLSYKSLNRHAHDANSEFNDKIFSDTQEIRNMFALGKSLEDTRNMVTSKLNTITKAIEAKRKYDAVLLQKADRKISDLQNNVKTYSKEILQVKERADTLEKEIMLDELTGINNRRAYDLQIRKSLRRYQKDKDTFSLILIDIDHFKKVNDEYGHRAGDKCLVETAKLIKGSLRKKDFLARYGGEEIIAILHGINAENAQIVAEKIRLRIEKTHFSFKDRVFPVTVSLGVTEVLPGDTDPEIPFIRVDTAMYRAKNEGRNSVRVITDLLFCKIPNADSKAGHL